MDMVPFGRSWPQLLATWARTEKFYLLSWSKFHRVDATGDEYRRLGCTYTRCTQASMPTKGARAGNTIWRFSKAPLPGAVCADGPAGPLPTKAKVTCTGTRTEDSSGEEEGEEEEEEQGEEEAEEEEQEDDEGEEEDDDEADVASDLFCLRANKRSLLTDITVSGGPWVGISEASRTIGLSAPVLLNWARREWISTVRPPRSRSGSWLISLTGTVQFMVENMNERHRLQILRSRTAADIRRATRLSAAAAAAVDMQRENNDDRDQASASSTVPAAVVAEAVNPSKAMP